MTAPDEATQRQIEASNPQNSTWLSANAGSGKTRVLTDRVARLLLKGTDPQNVLCLTYTKAAASEMQNRLFQRLGAWAMMDDSQLRAELRDLGELGSIDTHLLRQARVLFAGAIETPGGLKIQTIHSFCAGLLRRFPLEAGISPQFTEMEDRAAELLRAEVVDAMVLGADADVVHGLAQHFSGEGLSKITAEIASHGARFLGQMDEAALAAALGLQPDASRDDAIDIAFDGSEASIVSDLAAVFSGQSKTYVNFAADLAGLNLTSPQWDDLTVLFSKFLYAKDKTSKSINFPPSNHSKAVEAMAPIAEDVHAWMDRTATAFQHLNACAALEKTRALYAFASKFVPQMEDAKLRRGMLSFDDQIRKARALLTDPVVAQWVLFRLDGGIDHILVDEAQDTSPDQWAVIRNLAQEFSTGEGARPDRKRTIFVVGDKKQSIYSFQGADPEGFDRMRAHFKAELARVDAELHDLSLEHSFRSSSAILNLVDHTFVGERAEGLESEVSHLAFKENMPGRVDLWPAIEPENNGDPDQPWFKPVDAKGARHHTVRLAEQIANEIHRMIKSETIPSEVGRTDSYERRPITAGDFLILVQRRSDLFGEIITACKAKGLDVAGADRLKLAAELAVKDITALLQFVALPEDDLSLAAALRSPLFGLSEQQLFTLAHGRPKGRYLWQNLRDSPAMSDVYAVLDDLLSNADFLRPYDLVGRILTRHNGRKLLLARLGPEAEDGIDALLTQALAYERAAVPSLTGFLNWLDTEDVQVKRQMDSAGDRIRVMTVHGAKGLESPIVILPDTAKNTKANEIRSEIFRADPNVLWKVRKEDMPPPMTQIHDAMVAAQSRERRRLLYVAMTRAEKWLIVCAAGDTGDLDDSWYSTVADGMAHAGAVTHPLPGGDGLRLGHLDWEGLPIVTSKPVTMASPAPPDFGTVPAPNHDLGTFSPSSLGGAKVMPEDPSSFDLDVAMLRGTLIHMLLEHLPLYPVADRPSIGRALMLSQPNPIDPAEAETLITQACALIIAPHLARVFADTALSEVDITADITALDGRRMHGTIDRLIITDDSVLIVDFKSNRLVPDHPDKTPLGLVRQLAVYRDAVAQIYPDHRISAAILWTATAELMTLSDALLDTSLEGVTVA